MSETKAGHHRQFVTGQSGISAAGKLPLRLYLVPMTALSVFIAAIGAAGRSAFFMLPQFKPMPENRIGSW